MWETESPTGMGLIDQIQVKRKKVMPLASQHRRPGNETRRDFLYAGWCGGVGLALCDLLRVEASGGPRKRATGEGPAQSVIHIFLPGGVAHQETWDPKPLAPVAYRGNVETIATRVPGTQLSSYLSEMSQILDQVSLCRSVTHVLSDHDAGVHQMFTGYRPSPVLDYPSLGSVLSQQFGSRNELPPYICVPTKSSRFAGSGYLSSAHGPFSLGSDPGAADFEVRDLTIPTHVGPTRLQRARKILSAVNRRIDEQDNSSKLGAIDAFYEKAYEMITSPKARAAFDLETEPPAIREEYGESVAGQRFLMARRLVEAGVRCVSLTYDSWDDHFNIAPHMKKAVPPFDRALAALIRDLDRRGLLESTLVFVSSEFGRTPKVNASAGRDHWSKTFSVLLAGAGVKRGYVHGTTNLTAAEPDTGAVSVQDLLTTVYRLLGIIAGKELMAPGARPVEIVKGGRVISELLA